MHKSENNNNNNNNNDNILCYRNCSPIDIYIYPCLKHLSKSTNIKQPPYRPGQTLRVPGGWGFQVSRQSTHEGGESVSQQLVRVLVNNTTISKRRCLIKDEVNYMFRPNVAIIRFSSESMVVVLYGIGMGMSQWWDLSICDVCYMLFIVGREGGICNVRYPGVCSSSMSARCCPVWVSSYCFFHIRFLLLVGFCYDFCGEEKRPKNNSWCVLVCVG